jgi:hypothetical protein
MMKKHLDFHVPCGIVGNRQDAETTCIFNFLHLDKEIWCKHTMGYYLVFNKTPWMNLEEVILSDIS